MSLGVPTRYIEPNRGRPTTLWSVTADAQPAPQQGESPYRRDLLSLVRLIRTYFRPAFLGTFPEPDPAFKHTKQPSLSDDQLYMFKPGWLLLRAKLNNLDK
jgi:hypothetical protein